MQVLKYTKYWKRHY